MQLIAVLNEQQSYKSQFSQFFLKHRLLNRTFIRSVDTKRFKWLIAQYPLLLLN